MNLKSVRVGTSMVAVIISLTIWISLLFPLGTVLAQGNQQYSFVTKWGSEGIGNGKFTQSIQFLGPTGLIVDPSDVIYVVDGGNNRIQVFAPT